VIDKKVAGAKLDKIGPNWLMLGGAGRGGFQPQSFGPPAQVLGMLSNVYNGAIV